ncbi:predicted protein [Sclerotinia sclerotiorum 1980 UF-70]|uniref:Uncharacterized protein n=1 Tax=Sclerotinia sclerotiorum (strain ATCC 18683 / 1980 / Ss-1) TaxID=665079 RepID=A7E8J1_SCLS1|nr:predicted protein [Sclerotinia sclerotiorum 1980 UF-70]EDN96693.1 predicted protein [Sclerotinia sclerotiorum 1980 UF-70]
MKKKDTVVKWDVLNGGAQLSDIEGDKASISQNIIVPL